MEIQPTERKMVPRGVALELPPGSYGKIATRSSFAVKGVDMVGGVIDPDFRGEVKIILANNGSKALSIKPGDRVGQLILEKFAKVDVIQSNSLSGFGSTGVAVRHGRKENRSFAGIPEDELPVEAVVGDHGRSGQSMLPPTPMYVFFDGTFWSREGELMAQFVVRLKSQDLVEFSWMFPWAMVQELQKPTSRNSPITFDQEVSQGVITVQMHRHNAWRKKLYDTEVSAPPPSDDITAGVVTLGTLENGSLFVRVDN
ncbi:Deoxyuridine 5'-triphosphate nucleotidohydrolase (dUTPase) (dUTP pyrophosphatase), partial [Durusdinium trenchii]